MLVYKWFGPNTVSVVRLNSLARVFALKPRPRIDAEVTGRLLSVLRESKEVKLTGSVVELKQRFYVQNFVLAIGVGKLLTIGGSAATDEDVAADEVRFVYDLETDKDRFEKLSTNLLQRRRDASSQDIKELAILFSHDNQEQQKLAKEIIGKFYVSNSVETRREVALLLAELDPDVLEPNLQQILLALLRDQAEEVQEPILANLAEYQNLLRLDKENIRNYLTVLLTQHASYSVCLGAARSLRAFGDSECIDPLINTADACIVSNEEAASVKQACLKTLRFLAPSISQNDREKIKQWDRENFLPISHPKLTTEVLELAVVMGDYWFNYIDAIYKRLLSPIQTELPSEELSIRTRWLNILDGLLQNAFSNNALDPKWQAYYRESLSALVEEQNRFRECAYTGNPCPFPQREKKRKIFVTYSFDKRNFAEALEIAQPRLKQVGIELEFLRKESRPKGSTQNVLCQRICFHIQESQVLLAEVSGQSISVGIETGLADRSGTRVTFATEKAAPNSYDLLGCHIHLRNYGEMAPDKIAEEICKLTEEWISEETELQRVQSHTRKWEALGTGNRFSQFKTSTKS